jgi:hypothetical protein
MDDNQKTSKKKEDSEDLHNDSHAPDDVTSIISGLGMGTLKTAVFLFILFILISSDVFIDRVLSSPDNLYTEGRNCTAKGTVTQGVILSLGFILIHTLVTCNYI